MKPGKSIYYAVIAAALLAFACTKSDNVVTNTENTSSPSSMENFTDFPYESPISVADESQGEYIAEQPVFEYQDLPAGEQGGIQICIWDFEDKFRHWYDLASSLGQKDVDECKRLHIRSKGDTVLEIKLKGECNLEIELNLDNTDLDTTINVCE